MAWFLIIGTPVLLGLYLWREFGRPRSPKVTWLRYFFVDESCETMRQAVIDCFGKADPVAVKRGTMYFYKRGKWSGGRDLNAPAITFYDLPMHVTVAIAPVRDKMEVMLRFDVEPSAGVRKFTAKRFDVDADYAMSQIMDELREAATVIRVQRPTQSRNTPGHQVEVDTDYAVLGLAKGASLAEVQSAYLAACRLHDPTGKASTNGAIEPATDRLSAAFAAYRRLTQRLVEGA